MDIDLLSESFSSWCSRETDDCFGLPCQVFFCGEEYLITIPSLSVRSVTHPVMSLREVLKNEKVEGDILSVQLCF